MYTLGDEILPEVAAEIERKTFDEIGMTAVAVTLEHQKDVPPHPIVCRLCCAPIYRFWVLAVRQPDVRGTPSRWHPPHEGSQGDRLRQPEGSPRGDRLRQPKIRAFQGEVYMMDEKTVDDLYVSVNHREPHPPEAYPDLEYVKVRESLVRDLAEHYETRQWAKVEQTEEGHCKNRDAY
jgi:hypothetical protein